MTNIVYYISFCILFCTQKNKLLILSNLIVKLAQNRGWCGKLAFISLKIVIFVVLFMQTKSKTKL